MSTRTVAIITASSNSGKYCIDELFSKYKNSGLKVRAAFRSAEKAKPFSDKYPELEIVTDVDAAKPKTLGKVFQNADSALIVTPQGSENDSLSTTNMINSAVENGVKYIVLVGSFSNTNMERMGGIGRRFKSSEDLLEKLGNENKVKWTVLRGGVFMENFLPNIPKVKAEGIYTAAFIQVPIVDTKDIGKSAAACLASTNIDEHDKKHYEMNGPEILSSKDIADNFAKALGIKVEYKELPKESFRTVMPPAVAELYE
jgi:uncharacterized protein YbjT (DUF2867 family)